MNRSTYAWGSTIFADDLRQEVGGKISLMGIYDHDMVFTSDFPITISKFVIFARYWEVYDKFSDAINIMVYMPGAEDPVINQQFDRPSQIQFLHLAPDDSIEKVARLVFPIVFSPLTIAKEGYIKVRVKCGDVITPCGALLVRKESQKSEEVTPAVTPPAG